MRKASEFEKLVDNKFNEAIDQIFKMIDETLESDTCITSYILNHYIALGPDISGRIDSTQEVYSHKIVSDVLNDRLKEFEWHLNLSDSLSWYVEPLKS